MTNYLLLTGAGFSRSWQAWLGFEVFAYLLGCEELPPATRTLLWQSEEEGKGFEYALAELQAHGTPEDVETLTEAIVGMFRVLGEHLGANGFNAGDFVRSFDAIFTLNQDLLLERKCGWPSIYVPGTRWNERTGYNNPVDPIPDLSLPGHGQRPYFKLHGSSDLFAKDIPGERPMLVMGAASLLRSSSIPSWSRSGLSSSDGSHCRTPDL